MDIKAKSQKLNELLDNIAVLTVEMEAEDGKGNTPENREKLTAWLSEGEELRKSIETESRITGLKSFVNEPFAGSKAYPKGGDGSNAGPFMGVKSLGDQIVEDFEKGGGQRGISRSFQAKGFLTSQ